jgi:hypothetical protein
MTQAAASQLLELPLLVPLLLLLLLFLLLQLLQHNNNMEVRSTSLFFFFLVKRNLKMAKTKCVFFGFSSCHYIL